MPKIPNKERRPTLAEVKYRGRTITYRPDTSDEDVLLEVLHARVYRKARVKFDVKAGEKWLDLGANIGAFGLYCLARGATADCYEPDPICYRLLCLNCTHLKLKNYAVSCQPTGTIELSLGRDERNHARGTLLGCGNSNRTINVLNRHASFLKEKVYDGVKMDIEGSEFDILDEELLPKCNKLVLEYHCTKDRSCENLRRRLAYLRRTFRCVLIRDEFKEMERSDGEVKTFYDRPIFCWN